MSEVGSNGPPGLSEAELEVMNALWDRGPGTVRAVDAALKERGRRWAYTTVLTLLQRLRDKGYVTSEASGSAPAHLFSPSASREDVLKRRLHELADQFCGGARTPLVLTLIEDQGLDGTDMQRLKAILERAERKS